MAYTTNGYFYKPAYGEKGAAAYSYYNAALDATDAALHALNTGIIGGEVIASEYGTPSWVNLQAAVAAAVATDRRLLLTPGAWPVTDNLSITIPVRTVPGATFAIATTKTLTFTKSFEAGAYQTFTCTGTGKVVFSSKKVVSPEWWGAVINTPATDCGLALNKAIAALPYGGVIEFQSGTYHIGTQVNLASDIAFKGYGGMAGAGTIVQRSANVVMFDGTGISSLVTPLSQIYRVSFNGLRFYDNDAYAADMISLRACMNFTFDNCQFVRIHGRAIFAWELYDSRFNNCYFIWSGKVAGSLPVIELKSSDTTYGSTNNIYFNNCVWEQNRFAAVKAWGNTAGYRCNQISFVSCKVENIDMTGAALDFAGAYGIRFKNVFVAGSLNIALDELVKFDQCDDVEGDMLLIIGLGGAQPIQRIMTINTGAGTVQGRYNLFLSGINWDSIAEAAAVKIDSVTYSPWVNIKTYGPSPGNAGYQCSTKALTNFPYTSEALYGSSAQLYAPSGGAGDLMEVWTHALAAGGPDVWARKVVEAGASSYMEQMLNNVGLLRLYSMGYMELIGDDFRVATNGKGIRLTNAAGTVTKRVRLNDAGDGLIFEAP